MFFIGIFGVESKEKEIKYLNKLHCKKCNGMISGQLIKRCNYFHFFYIPLFRWNEKYYLICHSCSSVYLISNEKGKAIARGENIDITYWDLQELNDGYYEKNYYSSKVCQNCGSRMEMNYKYCPHCGAKN